jgi:signal transduction histidine kinase/PAS domain-containing protein
MAMSPTLPQSQDDSCVASRARVLEETLEALDVAVTSYGPDDRLVYWNTAAATMFPAAAPALHVGMTRLERAQSLEQHGYLDLPRFDLGSDEHDREMPDGRHIRARRYRRRDGGMVYEQIDLTNVRQSEARLADRRIRNAIEHMPLGVIIFDSTGHLAFVNSRMHGFAGFLPPEPIGLSYHEIADWRAQRLTVLDPAYETDPAEWHEGRKRAFYAGQALTTIAVRSPAGQVARVSSGRMPDGGVIHVHEDITATHAAETRLRLSLEVLPVGVILFDNRNCCVMANSKLKELVPEVADQELAGKTFAEVAGLARAALADDSANTALRTEAFWHERSQRFAERQPVEPFEMRTRSGKILRVTRSASATAVIVVEDMTEIRRAEERYRDTVESLPVGVLAFDASNRVAVLNSMTKLLMDGAIARDPVGASYEQVIGALRAKVAAPGSQLQSDEWLRERSALFAQRAPAPPYEFKTRAGRVLRVLPTPMRGAWVNFVIEDVTEFRRAEQRLRDAIDAIDGSITLWGPDDRLVLRNSGVERLFPKVASRFIPGAHYGELQEWGTAVGYIDPVEQGVSRPARFGSFERQLDDGRLIQIKRFATAEGGFLVMATDVTALKRAEQRLVEAISALTESFALYDAGRRLVLFNEAFRRELAPIAPHIAPGLTFERQVGLLWDAGVVKPQPGETREQLIARQIALHEAPAGRDFQNQIGDRTFRVAKRRTAEGGVVRIGSDITELVRQQREIERLSEAQLAKRTQLLQLVLDNVRTGLAVFDTQRRALLSNRRFAELLAALFDFPPPTALGLDSLLDELGIDPGTRLHLLRCDGSDVDWRAPGGRYLRLRLVEAGDALLLALADLTAMKREEQARLDMQERLLQAQKVEALGTMTGALAHDFNNILAVILGFAAMTRAQLAAIPGAAPPTPMREDDRAKALARFLATLGSALDNINRSASRGREIIEKLSSYRKRESSHFAATDIRAPIADAARLVAIAVPSSIRFVVEGGADPLTVRANSGQLEQVIMNLCLNAAQSLGDRPGEVALRAGTIAIDGRCSASLRRMGLSKGQREQIVSAAPDGSVKLWIGTLEAGPHVRISVVDNGSGMDLGTLSRIFESFYTTKTERGGTGLGLASVKSIVEAHAGAIFVHSRPRSGSEFVVYLPLLQGVPLHFAPIGTPAPHAAADDPSAAHAPRGEPRVDTRAMVIDDDCGMVELVSELLATSGFEVEGFVDPAQAMARLKTACDEFDLIVTDQTMPGITGRTIADVSGTLRPDLPVIIMTGYSTEALDEESLPAAVKAVARKPIAPDDLLAMIRKVLGGA